MQIRTNERRIIWIVLALVITGGIGLGNIFLDRDFEAEAIKAMSWMVAGHIVVVDPGHGGEDPGKVSPSGIYEKDINLAIAKKLAALLSHGGAQVIMTRNEDKALSNNEDTIRERKRADLTRRIELARESQADFYISLHCNSFPSGRWSGAQTFYAPAISGSRELASFIQEELITYPGNTNRKPKQDTTSLMFKMIKIPIVNVEMGFLSNPIEERLLQDAAYQDQIAWSIYAGLVRYLADNDNYARHIMKRIIK